MVLKISRGVWFVSALGLLAALLYVYAMLPEELILTQEGSDYIYGSREPFFYVVLVVITLINALVFLVSAVYEKNTDLRTWFNGLITVLNIFFVMSLFLVGAMNSSEKFDYADIGFLMYGSVILIAVWAAAWPVFLVIRKFSSKAAV